MKIEEQTKQSIYNLPKLKRSDIDVLHKQIIQLSPKSKLLIWTVKTIMVKLSLILTLDTESRL